MEIRTFVRVKNFGREDVVCQAKRRDPNSLEDLPTECVFYFFDRYIEKIKGIEYPVGPEVNVSRKYYKAGEYSPNIDTFRVNEMRCYGYKEETIFDATGKSYQRTRFSKYTPQEYPKGVVIVDGTILNPKDGIVYTVKRIVKDYEWPDQETIEAYKSF